MTQLTRDVLEEAFTELGRRAEGEGRVIDIAVYGGSALILASNFRAATADVDAVAVIDQAVVTRLATDLARDRDWPDDWLNDGVRTYLSPNVAGVDQHHMLFRAYPDEVTPGLRVFVPSAEYMLALKLHAMRVDIDQRGKDSEDIKNLLTLCNIETAHQALAFVAKFFPEYEPTSRQHARYAARFDEFFARGISPAGQPVYRTPAG